MATYRVLVSNLDFLDGEPPSGWGASVWEIDGPAWTGVWQATGFGTEQEARRAAEEWVERRRGDG